MYPEKLILARLLKSPPDALTAGGPEKTKPVWKERVGSIRRRAAPPVLIAGVMKPSRTRDA